MSGAGEESGAERSRSAGGNPLEPEEGGVPMEVRVHDERTGRVDSTGLIPPGGVGI
jgi:hypothetical protein